MVGGDAHAGQTRDEVALVCSEDLASAIERLSLNAQPGAQVFRAIKHDGDWPDEELAHDALSVLEVFAQGVCLSRFLEPNQCFPSGRSVGRPAVRRNSIGLAERIERRSKAPISLVGARMA